MNKITSITTIALVAVVMGMSTIAPAAAANPLRITNDALVCNFSGIPPAGTLCVALDVDGDGLCDRAIGHMKTSRAQQITGGLTCDASPAIPG